MSQRNSHFTIPIVFISNDPIKEGMVASFNGPGGNATGFTVLSTTLEAKRLALLLELIPKAVSNCSARHPNYVAAKAQLTELQKCSARSGPDNNISSNARPETKSRTAFASISKMHLDALLVGSNPFFNDRRNQIIALAARHAIPTMPTPGVR